jgi:hypothetical protein
MKKVLVSLVSDQTIPNIIAIRHFCPDELLFVSTLQMENKGKSFSIIGSLKQAGLSFTTDCIHTLTVSEDSILDCHARIEEWMRGRDDADYIVNLTGGTKMMSIAVYEFFKDYGARMIYMPIGRNEFITPFPKRISSQTEEITCRLSVRDYLAAYNLRVTNEKTLAKTGSESRQRCRLSSWMIANYADIKSLLERLGEKLRKQRDERNGYQFASSYVPATAAETELLTQMDFSLTDKGFSKHLTQSEVMYVTGGWLEEYCFNEIAVWKGRGIDDVVTGIKVMNDKKRDNEFDVMFTAGNVLYTVECKSLDQNDDPKADVLYKIAALQKDFGLRVESFLVSTSPHILRDGKLKPVVEARAEQFRTTVIPPHDVIQFGQILAEKLKLKKEC